MQIVISVTPRSCYMVIYYDGEHMDHSTTYCFIDMRHLLAHFGAMLPLTTCEIHVKGFTS